ncbi:MAG TPA: hypothetical protein VHO70_07920 [Chitinispirillaceae bacterium]|nr:hypothetical protein [Chitinispirillaceae bacterium]
MEQSGSNRKRTELTHRERQQGSPAEPESLHKAKLNVPESDLEHVVPPVEKRCSGKHSGK